jgi:hypothetical protein
MNHPINIVLFRCRKQLAAGLKKNLIHSEQNLTVLDKEEDLIAFCSHSKYYVVVYDGLERKKIKSVFEKIKNHNTLLVFLLSVKEARTFSYRKNLNERIYFFSHPPHLQELARLLEIIYKSRRLEVAGKEYDDILKAYEQAGELSRNELMNIKESLSAWEKVAELSRTELLEYSKEKEAYDALIEFISDENMFKDKVLKAWEQAMELGRDELMKAYEQIKKHMEEKELLKQKTDKPAP